MTVDIAKLIDCPNIYCNRQDEIETIEALRECSWCDKLRGEIELDRAEEIIELEEYDE